MSKRVIRILHNQHRLNPVSLDLIKKEHIPEGGKLYFAWIHAREFDKEEDEAPLICAGQDEPPLGYIGGKDCERVLVRDVDTNRRPEPLWVVTAVWS